MGLPSLCGGLYSGLMSLSAQNPWGTDVSLTTSNQQCASSHHVGNAGYHPAAGCSWQRTDISSFHPQCIRDTSTSNGCKMAVPFIWSGSIYTKAREDSRTRQHSQGATSPKWKKWRSVARPLKENCWEAFSEELELIRAARWDYYNTHWLNYEHEGSYDLSSTFRKMATSANLMGSEVHEVQEAWTSQKDIRATHHVAKTSPKDIHFFRVILPTKYPTSWAWGRSFPPRCCNGGVGCPVHGA